jgi:superfamily II DNA or RNA helicase
MFSGFDGLIDTGEAQNVRIMIGNVTSSIVCAPYLLKQLHEVFSYQIMDSDRIRDHKIAHHMKEASQANLDGNEQEEKYHLRKAEEAQDWEGQQSLFNKTRVGTGLVEDVMMWLEEHGHTYTVIDRMKPPIKVTITKKNMFDLYDMQTKAMTNIIEYDYRGILQGATGYGKTVVATHIIYNLQTPTVIISDKKKITSQWVDQIKEAFDLTHEEIKGAEGHYFYSHYDHKPVIMILTSSLVVGSDKPVKSKKLKDRNAMINTICANAGLLIYDEAHHAGSTTGKKACMKIKSYYRIGLTATANMRSDGADPEYLATIGQVVYYLPPTKLIDLGYGKNVIIRGETVKYKLGELETIKDNSSDYDELYDNYIIHNSRRNNHIGAIILDEASRGNTILVLVDRLDQARSITLAVGTNVAAFTFGNDTKEAADEKIRKFRNGEISTLICTHQLAGEGFDVPRINRMILSSGKAEMKTLQAVGRTIRKSSHKEAIVYDIIDPVSPFSSHFLHRLEVYQSEDGFIIENEGRDLPFWVQNYLY